MPTITASLHVLLPYLIEAVILLTLGIILANTLADHALPCSPAVVNERS